ncbi:hypothetical protein ACX83E_27090, partial [Burkholderia pseudomallei]
MRRHARIAFGSFPHCAYAASNGVYVALRAAQGRAAFPERSTRRPLAGSRAMPFPVRTLALVGLNVGRRRAAMPRVWS